MIETAALPLSSPPSLFERAVDVINPLQHIPFVNFLYRNITGDTITPDANFAGGLLYGGPIGALGAAASMILGGAIDEMGASGQRAAFAETKSATDRIHFVDPWHFNS